MEVYPWGDHAVYILRNKNNSSVHISDFGAIILKIFCADQNNISRNVVLGYETPDKYIKSHLPVGVVIELFKNSKSYIDGGKSFRLLKWNVELYNGSSLILRYNFSNESLAYLGLGITVSYFLNNDNELIVKYFATSVEAISICILDYLCINFNRDNCNALNHVIKINYDNYKNKSNSGLCSVATILEPNNGCKIDILTDQGCGAVFSWNINNHEQERDSLLCGSALGLCVASGCIDNSMERKLIQPWDLYARMTKYRFNMVS